MGRWTSRGPKGGQGDRSCSTTARATRKGEAACDIVWCDTTSGPERLLRRLLLGLLVHLGVDRRGLVGTDVAVAVLVDLLEVFQRAQPLAGRHVAVAVGVHLAEPQRPGGRATRPRQLVAVALPRLQLLVLLVRILADAGHQVELLRDFLLVQLAVAVRVQLLDGLAEVL